METETFKTAAEQAKSRGTLLFAFAAIFTIASGAATANAPIPALFLWMATVALWVGTFYNLLISAVAHGVRISRLD